jgi:hypothetical protein
MMEVKKWGHSKRKNQLFHVLDLLFYTLQILRATHLVSARRDFEFRLPQILNLKDYLLSLMWYSIYSSMSYVNHLRE